MAKKYKILIADDIQKNRRLLRKMLEWHGHTVEEAGNGAEALEMAQKEMPDVIISDILMPVMDGFQLCRNLKTDKKLKEISVIFYSATYSDKESEKLALDLGADAYIIKPIEPDELIRMIEDIFNKQKKEAKKPVKKPLEEKVYMKLYNERLVNKLEKKMLDLERSEKEVKHINTILTTILDVNRMIIKESDLPALLQKTCDRLTKKSLYTSAWFGIMKEDGKRFDELAVSGFKKESSRFLKEMMAGNLVSCAKKALKAGSGPLVMDRGKNCDACPFKDAHPGEETLVIRGRHADIPFMLLAVSSEFGLSAGSEEKIFINGISDSLVTGIYKLQAEESLRQSEKKYRNFFQASKDTVYITSGDGKFLDLNDSGFELFGIKKKDLHKINIARDIYVDPADRVALAEILDREGYVTSYGLNLKKMDGTAFPATITTVTVKDAGGNVTECQGIIRDESERRHLESQLQQAQKMEAVGTLAGGIAHDFNNILAAIIGFTEIASLQITEDDKAKESLKEVLKAGYRARDLVNQILAFSRQSEQELKPVQASFIVKEALELLRASLPTTIDIRRNIKIPVGQDIVNADPTQIHQVLMNLCTNAAHAMREEGGVLEVNLRNVDFGLGVGDFKDEESRSKTRLSPGPYLRLTVSDTGSGMAPDVKERIFDPYFTNKEKGEGTGMGLSVVYGIVKDHGGAITVFSEPGKGTTFHVYLPLIEKAVEPKKETVESLPTGHERILFIDDERTLVNLGKQTLERLGYEVVTKTSSLEALELFRTKPAQFDLVITDMTMPQMTGDKLAKEMMAIRPDIPIILCTGFSERITEEKAKGMGIREFVMKPFVMTELAKLIRKVLDQKIE